MPGADAGHAGHWERLEFLYLTASGLPAAEQTAFLAAECPGDDAMRRELDELLACSPVAADFFHRLSDAVHAAIVDPPRESADALVGTMLGHYRLEARVGAGGMGVVYRAYDVQLQRVVALKVLSDNLSDDEGARKRFLTEARAAAALDHPNICTIYETGETDTGVSYITMAFCDGETLKANIARGRVPISDAVSFALQMARGLAAAHGRGIIHRDVKPANVMIVEQGQVKLVDFGLARLRDATVTNAEQARGTFAYMAPELLRGQPADARTDLWSLGVVLYEMLTGRRPFRADSDAALLYTIAHERPEPIENVLSDLPDEFGRIVDHLLDEDANARYRDARDVIADLERLIASSVQTTPAGSRTIHHPVRRKRRLTLSSTRWLAVAGGFIAILLVVFLALRDSGTRATGRASPGVPRVAVLFFHDDTPDGNASSVASTLTNRLIDALAGVPGLDVPSLNAMQPYRGRSFSISALADSLGAAWLIGGFVEHTGDRIVVTAELSDSTGRRLDFRRVERSAGEELALIEATVDEVAIMLRERVGEQLRLRRWQAGTTNAQVFALLQQAAQHVADADSLAERSQPRTALAALSRADDVLARATTADPTWPEPLIERAWVARELAYLMFGIRVGRDSLALALEQGVQYASAALRLRRDAARAYEVRGVLRHAASILLGPDTDTLVRERQLADAERDLELAVENDLTLARALNTLSVIQFARGDFEQARLTTERAYRADYYFQAPEILFRLFNTTFETGQDGEARKWCALISRRAPEAWYVAYCRLMLMTWSPDEPADADTAWQLVARATRATPVAIRNMINMQLQVLAAGAIARAVSGDSALRVLERTRVRAAADPQLDANSLLVLQLFEAGVRVRLGQTDVAAESLKRYLDELPRERDRIANSRIFATLFSDPRLQRR